MDFQTGYFTRNLDANDSRRNKKSSTSKHFHLLRALLSLEVLKIRYFLNFTAEEINLLLSQFSLKILLCAVAGLLNSLGQSIPKKSVKT